MNKARNYFIRLIREIKENERNDRLTIIDVRITHIYCYTSYDID